MFYPEKEFEKDKNNYNKLLNFTYIWKNKKENYIEKNNDINEYKDKLGWYVELYSAPDNEEDLFSKIYSPYKELNNVCNKISIDNKFISNDNNFILKKENLIYKGTKYFYNPEQEKKFFKENLFGYYGDKYTAYKYSKLYGGGLQVYKLNKDLKLFNVTNDKNIKAILNFIKKNFLKKGKGDDIFFDKVSYKEFYKSIKTKFGVDINKYQQANNISKYTKFNELWLYLPKKDNSEYININDKSYTGWYFGSGYIDRVCSNGIRLLIKNKFDGISSKSGFFTPYRKSTLTGKELIIWKQESVLKRLPEHELDSMQFIKHLHFNPFDINFNIKLSNKNFKMINFYLNNKIDQQQIKDIKKISIKKNQLKIMSLNVNNLKSINLNDTSYLILEKLIDFIEKMDIDICFLQEYYTDLQINSKKYNYIKNINHIGLVILYKNKLKIKNINFFKLNNEPGFDQRRFCLHFEFNNKKFSTTHLEIGKSFFDRNGQLYNPKELYEIINFNYELRKNQIKQILNEVPKPDFIIGDFNFNSLDKEYKYLTNEKKYYSGLVDYTTPFEKQVDFIFSKKPYKFFTNIKYPYSDHIPVFAIIDT